MLTPLIEEDTPVVNTLELPKPRRLTDKTDGKRFNTEAIVYYSDDESEESEREWIFMRYEREH